MLRSSSESTAARRRIDRVVRPLLAAGAALTVLWANASPLLPGLHSDGVQYLEAAEALANLEPPRIPIARWYSATSDSRLAHYPPGFPVMIAPLVRLGVEPIGAAVLTMAIAAGLTLLLAFDLGRLLAGTTAGVLAAAFIAFYPEWLRMHTSVWSEPLYLALLLAAVLAMVRYPERASLHGWLAAACVAVRYIGVVVPIAAVTLAWRGNRRGRIRRVAAAGLPSLCFIAGWSLFANGEDVGNIRRFAYYPGWTAFARPMVSVMATWAAPRGGELLGLGLLIAIVWLMATSPIWVREDARTFRFVALVIVTSHTLVLVLSRALADPAIPVNGRMLLPMTALGAIALGMALPGLGRSRRLQTVATLGAVCWMLAGGSVIRSGVATVQRQGQFYSHVTWMRSPLIAAARAGAMEGRTLYSNEPELIFLYSGVPVRRVPVRGDDLSAWPQTWRERPGPLVLTNPARPEDLPVQTLIGGLPLDVTVRTLEGIAATTPN